VADPHPVRIPRVRESEPSDESEGRSPAPLVSRVARPIETRPNVAGAQRAVRLAVLFLVLLAALYVGFVVYDASRPGGSGSPEANGILVFTAIFAVFAVVGVVYTLTPAPRRLEVGGDHVTVVGRWGRRRRLPELGTLTVRIVRRYREGWLASKPVVLLEVWGDDTPVRGYLVEAELFEGARASSGGR